MALEGISGAGMTYQAPKVAVNTPKNETNSSNYTYSGEDGTVSAISKDTLTVKDANNASNNGNNSGKNGEERKPSEETMKQALSDINRKLDNTECVFGMHEETKRVTIQIIDKDTKEIIKELPPEKTLDMIAKVWELAGILVDEKL